MTAEALSLRAHLARDTVGRWIRGTTVPTLVALRAVEGVLSSRLGYEADLSAAVRERRSARQRDQLPALPLPHPEPAYRATLREFGRALHQRMPQLLGRDRELAEIAAFATGREGYRRLVGGAFAGKTALLYEAVTAGLPETVDVVCYFLSRRASDASSDRFLATVVPQLDYLCGVADPGEPRDRFRALWEQAADRAMQSGRYLLLVVDGLDEDLRPPGSPSVASLLPALAGGRAHVLVSSRPRPELPDDVPGGHPLGMTPTPLVPFEGAQELADLAKKEINDLTRGDDAGPAVDVLGLLTAAAGELSVRDLVALQSGGEGAPTAADSWRVRRLVEDRAARSLERVGSPGSERYRFAHDSLLEYAITVPGLCDPEYRQRIHRWAERWRDVGWPVPAGGDEGTPRYLLGTYPSTLIDDPRRLAQLVSDIGWVEAAARTAGVDLVLANLRAADATNPASAVVAGVLATVTGQAHNLRPPQPLDQAGYILRQLWMQAAELAENDLADGIRSRLQSRPGVCLMPRWTTRRASRALAGELGRHDSWVNAVAVLDDGRVVTGGSDNRVLLWEPARPETSSTELGRHNETVSAVAALPDGRVVTAGHDMRVLVWDPARPGAGPVELGRSWVGTVAVLPDGRVVTGGSGLDVLVWDPARPGAGPAELGWSRYDWVLAVTALADGRIATGSRGGQVLIWDPARPGTGPAELGHHEDWVPAVAALADGRIVTGGHDGRVLVWDPARRRGRRTKLGHHDGGVLTVAVLADGRVVTGGLDGRVLMWDPAHPRAHPAELGRHEAAKLGRDESAELDGDDEWRQDYWVEAMAALTDGRVVSGGIDGRVLMWDPARPGTGPAELGRHDTGVEAVAVLADGRVVTGGRDGRVLVRDPTGTSARAIQLNCSVTALATAPRSPANGVVRD